jgi:CSLREA domain-containing protein
MNVFLPSRSALARAAACAAVLLGPASARASTITVNSASDVAANDGQCTLREAIIAANTNTTSGAMDGECAAGTVGLDTIGFAISGDGVKTLTQSAALPAITEAVVIDGYTQPGSSVNTNPPNAGINAVLLITLDGNNVFGTLKIGAAGTTIRGLVLNQSAADEIAVNASNVTIAGNFIGTNPAGTAAMASPGGGFGIRQISGDKNVIGGPVAADRNLISGAGQGGIAIQNGDGTLIQGNTIGPDITGTVSLSGTGSRVGITISGPGCCATSDTVVSGNLISGNSGGGVISTSTGGVLIQGNLIGTQREGVGALGNGQYGVFLKAGTGSMVGGTKSGQGNSIAFNQAGGVGILGPNAFNNGILGNSIFSNVGLGITLTNSAVPLPNDPCDANTRPGNRGQNYPVIALPSLVGDQVTISGMLNSTANTTFRIEFFSNVTGHVSLNGEGRTFLGYADAKTDASCNASFGPLVFTVPRGQIIFSATATDPANNTSEFSLASDD